MNEQTGHNQVVPAPDAPAATEERQGLSVLARAALGVVVVTALIISVTSVMRYNELEARKRELRAQVEACDEDIAELQYLINAPMDESYVTRVAREKLHLCYPDEDLYYSGINSRQ